MPFFSRGGGILGLNAVELNQICTSANCTINTNYNEITNNSNIPNTNVTIYESIIDTFINYGALGFISVDGGYRVQKSVQNLYNYGSIHHLGSNMWDSGEGYGFVNIYNYGTIGYVGSARSDSGTTHIYNYGTMGYVGTYSTKPFVIDNHGVINTGNQIYHFYNVSLTIANYAMIIKEDSTTFNGFTQATSGNNSHIIFYSSSVKFSDSNSKIILDFGNDFEFEKSYSLDKIMVKTNGTTALSVPFSHLTTRSDLYYLTQQGNNFIAHINAAHSTIGTLYKSNIRTMNNFTMIGNSMIYPHKYKSTNRGTRKRVIRRVRKTASAFYRHTEHSEVSKTRESNQNIESMTDKRINELDSTLQQDDSSNFASSDLDSSLQATLFAQNDESFVNDESLFDSLAENDESFVNNESLLFDSLEYNESFALASLSLNESFFYKSDSLLLADSQNEQRAKRMRNSTQNLNTRSVNRADSMNQSNSTNQSNNNSNSIDSMNSTNQTNNPNRNTITSQTTNRSTKNDKYYFTLTPFVNHNFFFESGRYNLSGLEYGFVTAFSGKLNNSNSLGTHFVFSYASLNDKDDSVFNIKSMNLNLGLNYKLDLIYDMFIKARIDGYYFLNEVKSISIRDKIKPNTIGFGGSIYYGKEWNFNNYGLLGLSGGLDYKGLYANEFIMSNMADSSVYEKYNKQLYNLLYLDLAVDYNKYFNSKVGLWGLNAKLGIKGNITNNALSKSKVFLSNNRSVDMIVDNDKVLGYANISGSYVLNTKDFDMEFSLAYYGNFGDRIMSNGGGFEWRVYW